jgi:putative endonuclease
MVAPHLWAGRQSERFACRWLVSHGLALVTGNYRCRTGELDLVMRDAGSLAIIEVRYRRSRAYGGALASVSPAKRKRIMQATQDFIHNHPAYRHWPLRFDVLALTGSLHAPEITWRQRAFTADN